MTELLTSAQMRAIERAAIESGAVTGLTLMERAGAGVVAAILAEWPALTEGPHRAVVLCGPGHNGGDGFVVARLLHQRGWEVQLFLYGEPDRLPPDARVNYERWLGLGEVSELTQQAFRARHPVHGFDYADLYVDAIFGAGLTRPPEGDLAGLLRHLGGLGGERYPRLVAVDAPSGLCLDSGRMLMSGWARPRAALTVTFTAAKAGHYLADGPELCGRLALVDLGIEPWCRFLAPRLTERGWVGPLRRQNLGLVAMQAQASPDVMRLPGWVDPRALGKGGQAHKFAHGHALILSGPMGRGGAARLAARGALRIGAGLVTLGAPPDAMAEHAAQLTAIMLREDAGSDALTEALTDKRINALCLGPGLGVDRAAALLPVVRQAPAVVLDADALTALAAMDNWPALLSPRCILTPHAGEFARLFPDLAAKLAAPATTGPAYSKLDATREAAARAGCVVLFKGADTVIAGPDGDAAVNAATYDRAAPWLATAGSGDVLAGFITGLLARGFQPFNAARSAAWLHVECARSFGPGLIAEDLPEALPKVFRALGL